MFWRVLVGSFLYYGGYLYTRDLSTPQIREPKKKRFPQKGLKGPGNWSFNIRAGKPKRQYFFGGVV